MIPSGRHDPDRSGAHREGAPGREAMPDHPVMQGRDMYVKELKAQVRDDVYVVDPHQVAEALLRRAATRRADAPSLTRRGARARAAWGSSPHPRD